MIMTFLLFNFFKQENSMESYDGPLTKLHAKEITYLQFLIEAKCEEQFKKWCDEHYVDADEASAEFFFDQYGFEDTAVEKEFIEPLP